MAESSLPSPSADESYSLHVTSTPLRKRCPCRLSYTRSPIITFSSFSDTRSNPFFVLFKCIMIFTSPEESIELFPFAGSLSYLRVRRMAKGTSSFLDCHMQIEKRRNGLDLCPRNLLPLLMLCARTLNKALEEIFPNLCYGDRSRFAWPPLPLEGSRRKPDQATGDEAIRHD